LVFEKNANFFAEICQKSQKIVIITSTPGLPIFNFFSAKQTVHSSEIRNLKAANLDIGAETVQQKVVDP
jgi:hypothetical protein